MKCLRCQHENRPLAKFCEECATPLNATPARAPYVASLADLTAALSEAHAQQTATAEILRVISSSPTEIQRSHGWITSSTRASPASGDGTRIPHH